MYTTLRYMQNKYDQTRLQANIGKIYDQGGECKSFMLVQGLSTYMASALILPDAPPLVSWIDTACSLAREWLLSTYANVNIDPDTQVVTLREPGPVPNTIRFHDHTALLELWKSTLDSEGWNTVTPQPAHDNLADTAEPKEKTEALQPPPSESAAIVLSDKSSDETPIPTSRKRGSQQDTRRRSKRLRQD